jgi:hypothetical protein
MSTVPAEPEESVQPTPAALCAAELNARIRGLWADGRLPADKRPEYEALVLKWATALEHIEPAA